MYVRDCTDRIADFCKKDGVEYILIFTERKVIELYKADLFVKLNKGCHFIVDGISSLSVPRSQEIFLKIADNNKNILLVIEDPKSIVNPKAIKTRFVLQLSKLVKNRSFIKNFDNIHNILDYWSLGEFLKPGFWGFKSFYEFRDFYANHVIISKPGYQYSQITDYKNQDHFKSELNELKQLNFLNKELNTND